MLQWFIRSFGTLVVIALATPSNAEPGTARAAKSAQDYTLEGAGASYEVLFEDDALDALSGSLLIPRIHMRPPPKRVLLIRERASFVPELLKSIEKM